MTGISKEEASRVIAPHFPNIISAWNQSWDDWLNSIYAANMQDKRVRADCVWNQFNSHAQQLFDGNPDVLAAKKGRVKGLVFDNRIFVRLKKAKYGLLSANVPTQASLDFHNTQLSVFGDEARLELIYILNKAETNVERIVLVQRHLNTIIWSLDVASGDNGQIIDFAPNKPSPNTGGVAAKSVVKSKVVKDRSKDHEPKSGS